MTTKLPLKIHEDKAAIDHLDSNLTTLRGHLEQVFTEYKRLDLGELDPQDLHYVLSDPHSYVESKCLDKLTDLPSYGGFKMNRAAVLEQLQLPSVATLQTAINSVMMYRRLSRTGLQVFSFDKGKVSIIDSEAEKLRDMHRVYATTQSQAEAAAIYQQFRESYIKLDDFYKQKVGSNGLRNLRHTDLFEHEGGDSSKLIFNRRFFDIIK